MDPTLDNKFNPQILALAFPNEKSSPLGAFGKAFDGFGKAINEGQKFVLEKEKTKKDMELTDTSIDANKQAYAFNELANPKKLKAADQAIELNQQTYDHNKEFNPLLVKNKELENDFKGFQNKGAKIEVLDKETVSKDTAAFKSAYATLKGLSPKQRASWIPTANDFYEWDGQQYSITPMVAAKALSQLEAEDLESKGKEAEITYKDRRGRADLTTAAASQTNAGANVMNAKTNAYSTSEQIKLAKSKFAHEQQNDNAKINVELLKLASKNPNMNSASMKEIANEAAKSSLATNAFKGILDGFNNGTVGPFDNLIDSGLNKVGVNTAWGNKNAALKQNILALRGAITNLIDLKGPDSAAKIALINQMSPQVGEGEDKFVLKTQQLYKYAIDQYESKLKTYNPDNPESLTPAKYAELAGNIAALRELEPRIMNPNTWGANKNKAQNQKSVVPPATVTPTSKQQGVTPGKGGTGLPAANTGQPFWKQFDR